MSTRVAPGHFDGDGCTFPTPGHLLPEVPMRVLTVRQPWAWAIVHGGKDVENRSRNIARAYGSGPVAIHVSLTDDINAFALADTRWELNVAATKANQENPSVVGRPRWWRNQGFIIGVVDLVEVHAGGCDNDDYPICSPWAEFGRHHLTLANPRPLSEPMPYRGALHLQTMTAEDEAELLRRLA